MGSWAFVKLEPCHLHSLPGGPTKAGGETPTQPLPPVGDLCSEGVRPVPEVLVAGAQHPAGSIPVGTWNPARPHRTQGLTSRCGPRGRSSQACSASHPHWCRTCPCCLARASLAVFCSCSRREGSGEAGLAWQNAGTWPSLGLLPRGQSLDQQWGFHPQSPGPRPTGFPLGTASLSFPFCQAWPAAGQTTRDSS